MGMSDTPNPWARNEEPQSPYDVSGYQATPSPAAPTSPSTSPAGAPGWGPYGASTEGAVPNPVPPPADPYQASGTPWPAPNATPAAPYGAPAPFGGPQGSQEYGTARFPVPGQPGVVGQSGVPGQPGVPGMPPAPQTPPPYMAAPPYAPAAQRPSSGGLAQLFDFQFQGYATPALVKIVYILSVAGAGLLWLMWIVAGFAVGSTPFSRPNPTVGVMALLFGWIPALLGVAYTRFLLEFYLATIRTSTKLDEIGERLTALADRPDSSDRDDPQHSGASE